uniref:Transcription factor TFIIIC triple barrel domain-containing protein n=1 Tax=Anopheles culicifacies TaxID=139723 RepID=A0A182MEW3_9DIPT
MSRLQRNATRSILDEIKMEVESHTQSAGPSHAGLDDDLYEEEITVFADFDICLDVDDPNLHIKVIGIESENPIIQVNDEVYRGTADLAFGTNVFFEKDPKATAALDPVFDNNIKDLYQYVGSTDKVLRMKRIFLNAKDQQKEEEPSAGNVASERDSSEEEAPVAVNNCEVNMTYEDALNLHLPEGAVPSRHIAEHMNGAALMQNRRIKGEPMQLD